MTIKALEQPDDEILAGARAIQQAGFETDGVAPFSEQVTLSWVPVAATAGERHLLVRTASGEVAGYAHLDSVGTAELAVRPAFRRRGHGRALLTKLQLAVSTRPMSTRPMPTRPMPTAPLRVWSHGDLPAARGFAAAAGYRVVRELLQLRRELTEDPAPEGVQWPDGVRVRAFRPGQDDAAWLRLNARAFAQHPEQGRITQADLEARMKESWFDPEGFLIAERDHRMIGFHWTKVHPGGVGEVYVLGVDPEQHGGGLGRALTLAGLEYLYRHVRWSDQPVQERVAEPTDEAQHTNEQPPRAVQLYVESDNAPALAVYRRLKFAPWSTDVMYEGEPQRLSG